MKSREQMIEKILEAMKITNDDLYDHQLNILLRLDNTELENEYKVYFN